MNEIIQAITLWFKVFFTNELIPEAIYLGITLFFGVIFGWFIKRAFRRIHLLLNKWEGIEYAPWILEIIKICQQGSIPFAIWFVGIITVEILKELKYPFLILEWLLPFFALWVFYSLFKALIKQHFKAQKISLWTDKVLRPVIFLLAILQVVGALSPILNYKFSFANGILISFGHLLGGFFVLYLFVLLGKYIRNLLTNVLLPRIEADPSIIPIIATISGYITVFVGMLIGLSVAGVDMTAMAVVVGGLSVGLGFGMQELVNNFISGFILLFERSLVPGDIIHTGDTAGIVEDISLRATLIRTFDNTKLIVPNGQLLGDAVVNYSYKNSPKRKRIIIPIGASYNDNPHEVMASLLETAKAHPDILDTPSPEVFLTDFGDNSINYELRIWVASTIKMTPVSSALRLKIWDIFEEQKFEMPYPQRDVHITASEDKGGIPTT
ncbi:MAG: mechanosensitive ion channel [Anaerolineales bacterium]|nr:mechanosensitive ion channel [Anaerolineales bacterium]